MNDKKITEFFIKLNGELQVLNTNVHNVLDKLTNHKKQLSLVFASFKDHQLKIQHYHQLLAS